MVVSYGNLTTYPPTQCGLATFSQALGAAVGSSEDVIEMVAVVDSPLAHPAPAVSHQWVRCSPGGAAAAAAALNRYDVAIVQHEYGIFPGRDGADVVDVVHALDVPTVVVLHTVLVSPSAHQRAILEDLVRHAATVVTMTRTAAERLVRHYAVDPAIVRVIPHGAVDNRWPVAVPDGGPGVVLTWGLLGEGKGIEWGIEAMALLADIEPAPRYDVVGQTHPRVLERDGEQYRDALSARADRLGVGAAVTFDARYLDGADLRATVRSADVVLLPYDSLEQVTSGVLIEAIAAGKPVVSTAFPHAEELLASGAGLVVPRQDPPALAAALRRVLTEPGLAASMACEARRIAPQLLWPAVAAQYRDIARVALRADPVLASRVSVAYDHLFRLSDSIGLFEHAEFTVPRPEHGYCVDDVARGLVVTTRELDPSPDLLALAARYLDFLLDAQDADGRFHNRRGAAPGWRDEPGVDDCWGRALWGLGTAAARCPPLADRALAGFELGARQRSPWSRATAFAALGAAEVCSVQPGHTGAGSLLSDAVVLIGRPDHDPSWRWPEPRLTYANAAVAETFVAAGSLLDDQRALDDGLAMLDWLLTVETHGGHLSVTPVGGWARGEPRPGFDQQPIEVAALADACARAFDVTGEPRWATAVLACERWFAGDNDARTALLDPSSGGACDGLERDGRNENQGAESTLALLTTSQQALRVAP